MTPEISRLKELETKILIKINQRKGKLTIRDIMNSNKRNPFVSERDIGYIIWHFIANGKLILNSDFTFSIPRPRIKRTRVKPKAA